MTLSEQSIKNPVMAWMLMIGIVVFGAISYKSLGVSLMPDVDWPVLTVNVTWTGAAPEVMENEVTDIIEQAVQGVQGVTEITSSSYRGYASITIQFDLGKDIDVAVQEVQAQLAAAQRNLPAGIDPPIIRKSNPDDFPIIWIALSGNRPVIELMEYTKDHLQDQFTPIPGVSEVLLGGYLNPALRVWLDPDKMMAKEITPDDVLAAISSGHEEVPAGYIDNTKKEVSIRVLGEASSVEEFGSIIIPSRKGMPIWNIIKIKDISDVEDGTEDDRFRARTIDGRSVGLGIKKQPGTNAVEVAHRVKAKVNELQKYLPEGMKLAVRFDTTQFIEDSAKDMNFIIALSVILTSLVCWLFLGSFATSVNVFLSIPMSIFGAFFIIRLFGFTLNTFTFLGLSLVIGIVVDDAIIMIENISRHREERETNVKAAIKGSREITFAAIASTIAILAIFLPVIFMQGVIGRYFFQFGITISSAVLFSLLAALTLTPMYAAQFLPKKMVKKVARESFMDKLIGKMRSGYAIILKVCLENRWGDPGSLSLWRRLWNAIKEIVSFKFDWKYFFYKLWHDHRWRVVISSLLFFIFSLFLFGFVKKEFVPAQDQGRFSININTPPGTAVTFSDAVVTEAEKLVTSRPDVQAYFTNIRPGGGGINVTLYNKNVRPVDPTTKKRMTQQQVMDTLRKQIKKISGVDTINIQDMSLMGFTAKRGYPVEFMVMGTDWDKLAELSAQMVKEMEKTGLMVDADTDYKTGVTELQVIPDRKKAAARQVSMATIGDALNALFGSLKAGQYTRGGKRYDIIVELKLKDRFDVNNVKKVLVRNNRGEIVKLSDVVTIVEKPTITSITRENRERAIRVFSNVATGKAQADALKAVENIGKKILPEGYRIFFTGSSQTFRDSFTGLYIALFLGIFVAYMVLGSQFNSFIFPISVLMALPFSVTGAFIALAISGKTLNIYSAIGLILLMGIVKKNSILLVDFTNQRREQGMGVRESLLSACPVRLRPIIMTSTATIAAAVPPALALGPGAETRVPMAIVVIGGVIFSTMLTLFVVPCVYSLLTAFESRRHREEVHEAMNEMVLEEKERLKLKPLKKLK